MSNSVALLAEPDRGSRDLMQRTLTAAGCEVELQAMAFECRDFLCESAANGT